MLYILVREVAHPSRTHLIGRSCWPEVEGGVADHIQLHVIRKLHPVNESFNNNISSLYIYMNNAGRSGLGKWPGIFCCRTRSLSPVDNRQTGGRAGEITLMHEQDTGHWQQLTSQFSFIECNCNVHVEIVDPYTWPGIVLRQQVSCALNILAGRLFGVSPEGGDPLWYCKVV